jgi:hypothetical protein
MGMAGIGSTGVRVSIKMGLTLTDMIGMNPIDSLTSVTQFNVVFVAQSTVGGMYAVNGWQMLFGGVKFGDTFTM